MKNKLMVLSLALFMSTSIVPKVSNAYKHSDAVNKFENEGGAGTFFADQVKTQMQKEAKFEELLKFYKNQAAANNTSILPVLTTALTTIPQYQLMAPVSLASIFYTARMRAMGAVGLAGAAGAAGAYGMYKYVNGKKAVSPVENVVTTEETTSNSNVQNIEAVVTENKTSNSNVKNAEAIAAYQNLPAETRFERVRAITDEQLALAKIALANGLTSTKAALSNALVATQNGAVKGYNETKGYVIANPKKSAGIALGTAAVVAGSVLAYKKGYLRNPFAKAAKVTPVVTKTEDTKTTPVVKPTLKKAGKRIQAFRRK